MATKKNAKKSSTKSKKTARKKPTPPKKVKGSKKLAKNKPVAKKAEKKKVSSKKKAPGKKKASGKTQTPKKSERLSAVRFPPESLSEESGDLQGLSRVEGADSESVDELIEEGNAFEADVVAGVESADDADEQEVHTHEVPEDDVPGEYLDEK
jgi:hypothetical protein